MNSKKIYRPWIKYHGGECPVMRAQEVVVKLRNGSVRGPGRAVSYQWTHIDGSGDIVEYCCVVLEQADLEAAKHLLRANDYAVIPPVKPLTFEDVVPMTEAPPDGTKYWVVDTFSHNGVAHLSWVGGAHEKPALRRRMAYLEKEHALIAAKHIFGLKGGEL